MAAKLSVRAAVRDAKREDVSARKALTIAGGYKTPEHGKKLVGSATFDSFVNFAHKLGVGADNALTSGSYGFNPITRNRQLLEWIHRGSWLGGVAIDIIADDMTRAGVDFMTEMDASDQEDLEHEITNLGVWDSLNEGIQWGRLYGGSIVVALIDGQDPKTPLRLESVGPDQFKGLTVLDRWMVEPSLEDLVTDYGPHMGLPKYYKVQSNAPALRGQVIHHSRVVLRHVGIKLPYQQAMTENLWGISVLERLYDRLIAFDSASTGAAQLVFKAHLRTLKIPNLREIVAAGGQVLNGLLAYTEMMRRFQGIEGMTLIDGEDEFEVQATSAFSGVDSVITQLAMQVSGALQIPMTRLFGQAPGGLSTDDESGMRTYHDSIQQKQRKEMTQGVLMTYKLTAASKSIVLPPTFALDFASLQQLNDEKKAEVAGKVAEAVTKALDAGLVTQQTGMQELRQSSRTTGIFGKITSEAIEAADDEVQPPISELDQQLMITEATAKAKGATGEEDNSLPGDDDGTTGQNGKAKSVGGGQRRRALVSE
jgi:phage-related protein (TIGR01555 family)